MVRDRYISCLLNISKKDLQFLIQKASETAPAQTIRIESGPVKIVPDVK